MCVPTQIQLKTVKMVEIKPERAVPLMLTETVALPGSTGNAKRARYQSPVCLLLPGLLPGWTVGQVSQPSFPGRSSGMGW